MEIILKWNHSRLWAQQPWFPQNLLNTCSIWATLRAVSRTEPSVAAGELWLGEGKLWCTNCRGSAKAVENIPALSSFPLVLWDLVSVPVLVSSCSCSRLSGKLSLRFLFCIPKGLPTLLPPCCCPSSWSQWSVGLTGAWCCRWECWNSCRRGCQSSGLWGSWKHPWCVC